MNRLQDAYECDLDLGDTVKSIFGGETDPTMRMIKVVPSFINRDFSVPPTSNLRPHNVHKRTQEVSEEHASKRRRVEQAATIHDGMDVLRDQPVPSTENSRNGSRQRSDHPSSRARSQARRSQTESSVLIVHGAQTGEAEFAPAVKQESPELGFQPPARPVPRAEPTPSAAVDVVPRRQSTREPSRTSRALEEAEADPQQEPVITETVDDIEEAEEQPRDDVAPVETVQVPEPVIQEAAPVPSPQPALEQAPQSPQRTTTKRKDVYDVPSSPEILNRRGSKTTRARSTRATNTVRKEVNLLNNSRLSSSQRSGSSDPVSAFLKDIAQSAQSEVQTPVKASTLKPAKPGSLKKPTRKSLPAVPKDSPSSFNASKEKKTDPEIQARLDKIKQLRMGTRGASKDTAPKRSSSKDTPGTNNQALPWTAESWGFDSLPPPNATAKETNGADEVKTHIDTQANGGDQERDKEKETETQVNGTAQESDEEQEQEPQAAPEEADESKSRSVSAAVSTRSSPVISRRPARYLSHSPTPAEGSASDEESEEPTAAQPVIEQEAGNDGDSSSESSDSSSEDEEEDDEENEEVPKPTTYLPPPKATPAVLKSSPPVPALTPSLSNPRPASAQPPIRHTPVPLPSNMSSQRVTSSQQIPSSQSVSVEAAARRPAARPVTRFSGFRTLREQLADAKSPTTTKAKAPYDPRMVALNKLSKGKGAVAEDEESSDEESSSSSSDSD
jgi:hypothetical protein